jgi:hypothetical protein
MFPGCVLGAELFHEDDGEILGTVGCGFWVPSPELLPNDDCGGVEEDGRFGVLRPEPDPNDCCEVVAAEGELGGPELPQGAGVEDVVEEPEKREDVSLLLIEGSVGPCERV